jgi:HEAT repeat protein
MKVISAVGEIDSAEARLLLRQAAQTDPFDLVRQRAGRDLALAGDALGLQVLRELLETADRLLGQSTAVALVEVARQTDAASPPVPGVVSTPS